MAPQSIFLFPFRRFLSHIVKLIIKLEVTSSVSSTHYFNNLMTNHWQWIQVSSCSFWHVASIDKIMDCRHDSYFHCSWHLCSTWNASNLYFRKGEVRHSNSRTLRTFTHLQLLLLFIKKISRKLFAKPMLLPFPAF